MHVLCEMRPVIFINRHVVRVLDIYVDKKWSYGKKGIHVGTLLIKKAKEFAVNRKASFLVAHVAQKNEEAFRGFWLNLGFRVVTQCIIQEVEGVYEGQDE